MAEAISAFGTSYLGEKNNELQQQRANEAKMKLQQMTQDADLEKSLLTQGLKNVVGLMPYNAMTVKDAADRNFKWDELYAKLNIPTADKKLESQTRIATTGMETTQRDVANQRTTGASLYKTNLDDATKKSIAAADNAIKTARLNLDTYRYTNQANIAQLKESRETFLGNWKVFVEAAKLNFQSVGLSENQQKNYISELTRVDGVVNGMYTKLKGIDEEIAKQNMLAKSSDPNISGPAKIALLNANKDRKAITDRIAAATKHIEQIQLRFGNITTPPSIQAPSMPMPNFQQPVKEVDYNALSELNGKPTPVASTPDPKRQNVCAENIYLLMTKNLGYDPAALKKAVGGNPLWVPNWLKAGTNITDVNQFAPGDIVVMKGAAGENGHIGLYIGNGRFLDAQRDGNGNSVWSQGDIASRLKMGKVTAIRLDPSLRGVTNQQQTQQPTGTGKYESFISDASSKYGVNSSLIKAMMAQESGGNPNAKSSAGALGLMQLMPTTAKDLGVTNSLDPRQNIDGGVRYMKQQLDLFAKQGLSGREQIGWALAAYNAGPGNAMKWFKAGISLDNLPIDETNNYVKKIMRNFSKATTKEEKPAQVKQSNLMQFPQGVSNYNIGKIVDRDFEIMKKAGVDFNVFKAQWQANKEKIITSLKSRGATDIQATEYELLMETKLGIR